MPRIKISPAAPAAYLLDEEVKHLRDLDIKELRARWHTVAGRPAPPHLSQHLLMRILAYRLQADAWGDLDRQCQRLLERATTSSKTPDNLPLGLNDASPVRKGTIIGREWNGHMHRVAVMTDGFAWNGKTYRSLSKVAFAITGTHWNGPRFFGLRHKSKTALTVSHGR